MGEACQLNKKSLGPRELTSIHEGGSGGPGYQESHSYFLGLNFHICKMGLFNDLFQLQHAVYANLFCILSDLLSPDLARI